MRNRWVFIFGSLVLMLLAVMGVAGGVTAQATTSEPLSISLGYSVWVGYGPWFIAQNQGYFADEGLNVNLVDVENPADRFTAMAGGQRGPAGSIVV